MKKGDIDVPYWIYIVGAVLGILALLFFGWIIYESLFETGSPWDMVLKTIRDLL
ncbi:hypothetical protein ACFLZN_02420 [Nanoarchaeota archaeon]